MMDFESKFDHLTSKELDFLFDLQIDEIEKKLLTQAKVLRPGGNLKNFGEVLHGGNQTWVGLDPQILNTPYSELAKICRILSPKKDEVLVDLGAGFGRLGLVLNSLYPHTTYLGFELVTQRVIEARRVFKKWNCDKAIMYCCNLTDDHFILPSAQYFFLYDYGKTSHIRKTLNQIESLTHMGAFKVIARGHGTRSIIDLEYPWLSQVYLPYHDKNFSIYTFS